MQNTDGATLSMAVVENQVQPRSNREFGKVQLCLQLIFCGRRTICDRFFEQRSFKKRIAGSLRFQPIQKLFAFRTRFRKMMMEAVEILYSLGHMLHLQIELVL